MPVHDPRRVARRIEYWFRKHQRDLPWRRTYLPYHVWVSEVMLQQTRMEVVLRYFDRFIARFPGIGSLARASDDEILAAWSGLGYYRRARMLRDGARDVAARFGGELPRRIEELMTIDGVGRYTAGAIASIAFGEQAPIVDGNVARILSRLAPIDEQVGSAALMRAAWAQEETLVANCSDPRAFNQGLMEIGALICTPRSPRCDKCPLTSGCAAFASGRTEELPAPKAKGRPEAMTVPLYLISDDRGRVLMHRGSGKLMSAMLHLPHGDGRLLGSTPLSVTDARLLGRFRHTITTRRIEFRVYSARLSESLRESDDAYEWVDPKKLAGIPHPSYVAKALKLAVS